MVNAVRIAEVRCNGGSGDLWVGASPGSKMLQADLQQLVRMGVSVVVCCMPWGEMARLGLAGYPAAAQRAGLLFYHYPLKDCTAPDPLVLSQLVPQLCRHLRTGTNVFVHCKAGLGRSASLCAACLLHFGYPPLNAIQELRRLRPGAMPMRCQSASILEYHARYMAT